jgi:hypothetical protein
MQVDPKSKYDLDDKMLDDLIRFEDEISPFSESVIEDTNIMRSTVRDLHLNFEYNFNS